MIVLRWAAAFGLAVAMCGMLAACQTPDPEHNFVDLSYVHHGTISLDVRRIEVVRAYVPPAKNPNVEHLSPANPLATAERWLNERLRAVGKAGVAQATISHASIIEVPLKRTKGIRGIFTKDQAERYDGLIEITIRIFGDNGREKASVLARVSRSRTVAEDVSRIERKKVWYELTKAMMNDLDITLQNQLIANLGKFVR